MNFNWRDVLIRNIPIDEVVERIAGLGVPGLVLLVAMAGSPWYGGAAIVSGLATLGGPFGMIGGIGTIVLSGFIAAVISKFGFERIFKRVLKKLKEQGKTKEEILREIDRYPIADGLKLKLRDYMENMEGEETESSELSERMQEVLGIMDHLIGEELEQFESRLNKKIDDVQEDLGQFESRLNKKIDDVQEDLNDRMDRSETKLKWFIGIAVVVGGILTSGIVALIVGFLN